jgi:uncharacterized protein (DUF362 family)/NAD-dependent dihydropyrimidine dehydrogenase PreA subunit
VNGNPMGDAFDHRVALVACEDYSQIAGAIARGLAMLGGLQALCPGERYLLKPNLLLGDGPERGSTTHPEFFRAVAGHLLMNGYDLTCGDSPGFGSPHNALLQSGLGEIAEAMGIDVADFVSGVDLPNPQGLLMKQFNLARGLMAVDGVINLPKFKTHGLMRLTGAVKNLFGCLPGVQKAGFHARLPDEAQFGQMLVDLVELIAPRLHILDGIWGMEGNGPRNGTVRKIGLILITTNPHALDHCVAQLMNLDPMLVPTLKIAAARGLYHAEKIEVLGESLEAHVMKNFQVNRSPNSTTGSGQMLMDIFKHLVTPRPYLLTEKCTHCGRCVQVCPAVPKAISFANGRNEPPRYHYQDCIRCYCCQEMCPEEAITIKKPPLERLMNRLRV